MPNWAIGTVSVQGEKDSILKFTERFIYNDEGGLTTAERGLYFKRSFVHAERAEIVAEIKKLPSEGISTFKLLVSFAWCVDSCLIRVRNHNEHITLADACKADEVSVNIYAEESDTEEIISCDSGGYVDYICNYMPKYECRLCGNVMTLPSTSAAGDFECCECGKLGLVLLPTEDNESDWEAA